MTNHRKSNLESSVTKEPEKLNEEQRKLQVTGGSTFILSLPKDWATKNELKRGSSMMVREEDDGSLSISPSSFPKKEKQDEAYIKTSLNENPDAIMRTAISAYLAATTFCTSEHKDKKCFPQNFETTSKASPETT